VRPNLPITLDGLVKVVAEYSITQKSRGKKNLVVPILLEAIFGKLLTNSDMVTAVHMQLKRGNAASMHATIERLLNRIPGLCHMRLVPSVNDMRHCSTITTFDFLRFMEPVRTHSGFRVNLVNLVRFILVVAYGITDVSGVCIDIWGDGMRRGEKDVTRFGVRILKLAGSATAQCSQHMFIFCAYHGHDQRMDMETNLGPEDTFGAPGWLYLQTKKLFDLCVRVTCTGDAPFLNRLIKGISCDSTGDNGSKLSMHVAPRICAQ
jgi:hypothetical protein